MNIQKMLEKIVGLPDYAVIAMYWPWPDGGYMAGCALLSYSWAAEQNLPGYDMMVEENNPKWNCYDGFECGINYHGSTASEAVSKLWAHLTPLAHDRALPVGQQP